MTFTYPTGGQYSAAKLDYLGAGCIDPETGLRGGVCVNRRYCPPLAPHGLKMIADGLMTLTRSGTPKTRRTFLTITAKGEAELARLEKLVARRERKYPQATRISPASKVRPGQNARTTAAIRFVRGLS